jgi:hypothetical protein
MLEAGFAGLESYQPTFHIGRAAGDKPVDGVDSSPPGLSGI